MKVWNYIVIMIGLVLGMHVLGISTPGSGEILNVTGVQVNSSVENYGTFGQNLFSLSNLWDKLFSTTVALGILVGLGLTGIVASFTGGRYSIENFIILPFITTVLILFVQSFLGIINHSISTGETWVATIIGLLLVPFMVGFALALVEFFRGTD